jgi:hypothetical protein
VMYVANRIAQLPAVIIGTYRSGYAIRPWSELLKS